MKPQPLSYRHCITGSLVVALLTLAGDNALAAGALAVDTTWTGAQRGAKPAYGAAVDHPTEAAARADALKSCRVPGCEVVGTFANSCYALVYDAREGSNALGWGGGLAYDRAEQVAINECKERGGYYNICSKAITVCDEQPVATTDAGAMTPGAGAEPVVAGASGDSSQCIEWLFDQGHMMETQANNRCNRPVYLSYCYTPAAGYAELPADEYCNAIGETTIAAHSVETLINHNLYGGSMPPGAGPEYRPSEALWRTCFHDEYSGFARPKFKQAYEEFDVLGTQLEAGAVIEGGRRISEYMMEYMCDPRQEPKPLPPELREAGAAQPGAAQQQKQADSNAEQYTGEMVAIPGGSFQMGDGSLEDSYGFVIDVPEELPVHTVTVRPFKLGKYEVTFAQWDACVTDGGCGGYRPDDLGWGRGNRPVMSVSWDDAQLYIDWLNGKTNGGYRLPSEAEWEYAARAGSTTEYSWGNDLGSNRANCDQRSDALGASDFYTCDDSYEYTAPVGSFSANAWGLYDMHGNVWEWVQDCWNESYAGAPSDGHAWTSGDCSRRVIRGGSWFFSGARVLRSAFRGLSDRADRGSHLGFRLAQDN